LAAQVDVSKSTIAAAESGAAGLDSRVLATAAALAGLRLVLVDSSGSEVGGMSAASVRDGGNRRFPAHLDTRYSDEGWWHGPHRYDREQPWYTFDRDRRTRDRYRQHEGTPEDHQLPRPGDSPQDRADARRREYWRRRAEERQRRFLAGDFAGIDVGFDCTCPQLCTELDDYSGRPVHVSECPCRCDVG
jgi:HTH-type transcriptional regulator/antitoxin HipB